MRIRLNRPLLPDWARWLRDSGGVNAVRLPVGYWCLEAWHVPQPGQATDRSAFSVGSLIDGLAGGGRFFRQIPPGCGRQSICFRVMWRVF